MYHKFLRRTKGFMRRQGINKVIIIVHHNAGFVNCIAYYACKICSFMLQYYKHDYNTAAVKPFKRNTAVIRRYKQEVGSVCLIMIKNTKQATLMK